MKYFIFICLSMSGILLSQCVTQKKAGYEFPAAMSANVKAEYSKICEKGQILYEMNCAGCHTVKKGRKEYIPDFTAEQLKGYELRVTNEMHINNITEETITAEELGYIMTFLSYKKKNDTKISMVNAIQHN